MNILRGHISFLGITIYGANAMNWAVNVRTKWGWLCFSLPVLSRFRKDCGNKWFYDWYIYLSPDGTPCASTFYIGIDKKEAIRAKIRKLNVGHGYKMEIERDRIYAINQKFGSLYVWDFEKDIAALKRK